MLSISAALRLARHLSTWQGLFRDEADSTVPHQGGWLPHVGPPKVPQAAMPGAHDNMLHVKAALPFKVHAETAALLLWLHDTERGLHWLPACPVAPSQQR